MKTNIAEATIDPHGQNIARAAKKNNLRPGTVYKRVKRGTPLERALLPVGSYEKSGLLNTEELDNVYTFILEFKHANGGMPPSLKAIQDGMGFASLGKARVVIKNLSRIHKVRMTSEGGKIEVIGERWLEPVENERLEELILLAENSDSERMRTVAQSLRKQVQEQPEKPKPPTTAYPWQSDIHQKALAQLLRRIESWDNPDLLRLVGELTDDTLDDAAKDISLDTLIDLLDSSQDTRIRNLIKVLRKN